MKTIKILALALIFSGVSIMAKAQVTGTAIIAATIIKPISIEKIIDMNFGNVAVSATAGTVVLSTEGTRTITGGVTLPLFSNGTVTSGQFKVTGESNYTYTITLPSTLTLTGNNGGVMTVDNFVSTPTTSTGAGKLNSSGEEIIKIGATLNVSDNQLSGVYKNETDFKVTVNYN